jgi:hypothetical protein
MRKRTTKFQQELKETEKVYVLFYFAFSFRSQVVTFGHTLKTIVFFSSFFLFGQSLISFQSHKKPKDETKKNRRK